MSTVCQLEAVARVKFNFDTSDPLPKERRGPWAQELVSLVHRHWSYRYLLVPTQPCPREPCGQIAVKVRIEPVGSGECTKGSRDYHCINVLLTKGGARSFADTPKRPGVFYESDVRPGGVLEPERTALHEAGHLFGLEHITCESNSPWCYGLTAGQADDVMGRGEYVSARDYDPFVVAAKDLTGGCDWQTSGGGEGRGRSSWTLGLGILGGLAGALAGASIRGSGVGPAVVLGLAGAAIGGLAGLLVDLTPGNVPTPGDRT
jgi:hypothetical protein